VEVVWVLLALAVCLAIGYLGYRIEPHHVSKDGTRFLSMGQWLSTHGDPDGRKREVWARVLPDGQLQIDSKRRLHREVTLWSLEGKSPSPPPKREVYVLRTVSNLGTLQRMTLRLPSKSRAVTTLDALLSKAKSTAPEPG
jgi:hypothetical protein